MQERDRGRRPPRRIVALEDQDVEVRDLVEFRDLEKVERAYALVRTPEVFAHPRAPGALAVLDQMRGDPSRGVVRIGENARLGESLEPGGEPRERTAVERDERRVVPFESGTGEGELHAARLGDDLDVLGAEFFHHQRPYAEEQRIARGQDADAVVLGERRDASQGLADCVLQDHAFALKIREETELSFAARQHLGARDGVHGAAREPGAAIVADADQRDRASHGAGPAESSSSAWRMATAIGLPPLRPRATM